MRSIFVIFVLSASAIGQSTLFRIQKFCELGGQTVTTQGLHSVTNIQRSFPSCTITVYLTGTVTVAAIFSDDLATPTPLANPFTANLDGSFGFYADQSSCYDVVTSGGNPGNTFPSPFTYSDICQGGTGGGGGGGPSVTCPSALYGGLAAWINSTTLGCTNLAYTDFLGGLFSQFYQALGPENGEVKLTTVGVLPTLALPAHTLSWVAPNVVPTSLRMNPPGVECADGQVWQQLSHGLDPTGTENDYFNCLTILGSALTIQTNSVANSNQALLNFLNSSANCGFTVTATNTSGGIEQLGFSGSAITSGCIPAQYKTFPCSTGIGDGFNAIPAQTYPQSFCYNDSGVTVTITGIRCLTDNNGTSTLSATNGAGTALLTGAVTCTTAWAAGTQSATVTIAANDYIKFSFVADGTSKQTSWAVTFTK